MLRSFDGKNLPSARNWYNNKEEIAIGLHSLLECNGLYQKPCLKHLWCVRLIMNFLIILSVKMSVESVRRHSFLVMENNQGLSPLTFGIRSSFGCPCSMFLLAVLLSYHISSLLSFLPGCPPCSSYYWLASCVELLLQNETEIISSNNNKKGAIITAVIWNHTEYCRKAPCPASMSPQGSFFVLGDS